MQPHTNVTGLILAGGMARRMGGNDKGLLEVAGKPLIAHIITALQPQVESILINANRNISQYQHYGLPVISDKIKGYQGPLAGMACGLQHCQTDYIITVPCDGPLLAEHYVSSMLKSARQDRSQICVAHDGTRLQPVYALIHRDLAADLDGYLRSGERKIDRWYSQHAFSQADFSSCAQMFTNINTQQDLEKARQLL